MWKVPSQGKSLSYSVNPYDKTVEFENSPQRKWCFQSEAHTYHILLFLNTCSLRTSSDISFLWNPIDPKMLSQILKKAMGIWKALITVKLSKLFSLPRHCVPFWGQKVYKTIPHSVLSAGHRDKKHKKIKGPYTAIRLINQLAGVVTGTLFRKEK